MEDDELFKPARDMIEELRELELKSLEELLRGREQSKQQPTKRRRPDFLPNYIRVVK
jgi:hypothetical protein